MPADRPLLFLFIDEFWMAPRVGDAFAQAEEALRPSARSGQFIQANQRDATCPVLSEKINCFALHPNQNYIVSILSRNEGRFAIVTNVGLRDAVDAMAHKTNAPFADGEIVWS